MGKTVLAIFSAVTMGLLAACATKYTPPRIYDTVSNEVVIDKPYDEAWRKLIDHASSIFFGVNSVEKDSGLMTLEFSAKDPATYIDCGYIEATNLSGQKGRFVELSQDSARISTRFEGKINVVMRALNANQTRMRVNARYVYSVRTLAWRKTWTFDTNGGDTEMVPGAGYNPPVEITCRPTGQIEALLFRGMTAKSWKQN